MSEALTPVSIRLGAQGRLVVPVELCEALGFKPGDPLVARGRMIG